MTKIPPKKPRGRIKMLTPRRKKIQKVSVIAEMVRTSIGKIGPKILPKNKKGAKILDPLKKKI
jgi:hypothetical protein